MKQTDNNTETLIRKSWSSLLPEILIRCSVINDVNSTQQTFINPLPKVLLNFARLARSYDHSGKVFEKFWRSLRTTTTVSLVGSFWFHMNRMKDSRKTEKPLAKCCSPDPKESHFSTELWLAMKSGYIQLQANHRHRLQDQIAMDGRQCSVFGGIRRVWSIMELLKPGETVNTERYRQKSFEWKTTRISKKATQSSFASW